MTLTEHRLIRKVLEAGGDYESGKISASQLKTIVEGVKDAAERDLPLAVRDALALLEGNLEVALFTLGPVDLKSALGAELDSFKRVVRTEEAAVDPPAG